MKMSTARTRRLPSDGQPATVGIVRKWIAGLFRRFAEKIAGESAAQAHEPLREEAMPPVEGGPPAHWVARVREGAPQLLLTPEEGGTQLQRVAQTSFPSRSSMSPEVSNSVRRYADTSNIKPKKETPADATQNVRYVAPPPYTPEKRGMTGRREHIGVAPVTTVASSPARPKREKPDSDQPPSKLFPKDKYSREETTPAMQHTESINPRHFQSDTQLRREARSSAPERKPTKPPQASTGNPNIEKVQIDPQNLWVDPHCRC